MIRVYDGVKYKRIPAKVAHAMWLCGAGVVWEFKGVRPANFRPDPISMTGISKNFNDPDYCYFVEVE